MSKKKQVPEDDNKWKDFVEDSPEVQAEQESQQGEEPASGIDFPSRENLEENLTRFEQEVTKYKDRAVRAQAELDNVRRRAERDITNAHKFANEKLLSDMLPVIDSMARGLEGVDVSDPKLKPMADGLNLTLNLLEKTLAKYGVEVINPEPGESFNPEFHEAMSMQADPEAHSNAIIQVLQKGYALNGRVLRAAMVIVAQ